MPKTKPARQMQRKPSAEIAVRIPVPARRTWELSPEEVTIVKNSLCKGASDDELRFCLATARRYRLDPFKREIWFVPRWDKNAVSADGKSKGMRVWTPTVGIFGMLHIAARDHRKDFGSIGVPEYGNMLEVKYTVTAGNKSFERKFKAPEWARVKVHKKGGSEPTEAIAYWDEYCPHDLSSAPFWTKMPRRMLGKCATALAIREAYPDVGALYVPEELQRMGDDTSPDGREIIRAEGGPQVSLEVAAAKYEEGNEHLAAFEQREKEQLAQLKSGEGGKESKRRMGREGGAAASAPEPSAEPGHASPAKPDTPPASPPGTTPEPVRLEKTLLTLYAPESQTWEITGEKTLMEANRDILKPFIKRNVKSAARGTFGAVIVTEDEIVVLGHALEERGIKLRELKQPKPQGEMF